MGSRVFDFWSEVKWASENGKAGNVKRFGEKF
jgi:hypothetical protein